MKPGRELLREARTKRGLSTRDTGRLLGKDHSVIVRWEQGHLRPDVDEAFKLKEKLGIPLEAWRNQSRAA